MLSFQVGQTASTCNNRCCQSCNYCQNGGTCRETCDEGGLRFTCSCANNYTGKYCDKQNSRKTCHEVRSQGLTKSGVYLLETGNPNMPSRSHFCDFDSENGSSWTLIESFSLENNDGPHRKPLYFLGVIRYQNSPTRWDTYRVTLTRVRLLMGLSTHWRATCNFNHDGVVYTDYIVARLAENDVFSESMPQNGSCAMYQSINIRGHTCVNCTALTFNHNRFHIDSYHSAARCQFNGTIGAKVGEDNFGEYNVTNPAFRCTAFANSTTQFWIGTL